MRVKSDHASPSPPERSMPKIGCPHPGRRASRPAPCFAVAMPDAQALITCPRCAHEFPLTEAVAQRLRGEISREFEERRRAQESALAAREKTAADKLAALAAREQALDAEVGRRLGAERERLLADAAKQEREKVGVELGDLRNRLAEQRQQLDLARQHELELRKQQRALEERAQQLELEVARRLDQERARIADTARQNAAEEHKLRLAEKEQLIAGLQQQIEALKQRAEQGSMQLQGEVLELELEQRLRAEFTNDTIEPVAKGVRGADVVQRVRTPAGLDCGAILWETKRTKHWAREWPLKMKEDQREARAELAVIVSRALPDGLHGFGLHEGVWVCDYASALPLAVALRQGLLQTGVARQAETGRQGKMEEVYTYLSGHEFRQRVEAIVEAFVALQQDLETEKRAMERQWSKRERTLRQVVTHTAGMYGSIQGILGQAALPEIRSLALPGGEETAASP